MKIVINETYGGFRLSVKGMQYYCKLKGFPLFGYSHVRFKTSIHEDEWKKVDLDSETDAYIIFTSVDCGNTTTNYPTGVICMEDIPRTDWALIKTVEDLGEEASCFVSNLQVRDIEDGRLYKITEYDGLETLEFRDIDDEWSQADSAKNLQEMTVL